MYATPVVDGNTVVPVRRPPGSMTQRARFGRSPRASRSRSTSDRAPSMSTRTTLIVSESTTRKRPRHLPRPLMLPAPKTLLDRDRDLHAERQVRRAVPPVLPLRRVGERYLIGFVGLRQEGARQIVDRVLHTGVERCRAARRNGIGPEGDVVRSARDVREADRRARRNRDRARLEGGLGAAVTGHLHFNDGTGRRGCSTGGRRGRRSLRLVLVLVALLTAGERADGHDRREQSEAHCGTPPRHGLRGCVACELF